MKKQMATSFKDGVVYINGEAKINLTPDSQVKFEEFEGNVVVAVKNFGQFIHPVYFVIQKDGKINQRYSPEVIGTMLNSTKAFVNRLRKLM